jgi:hypothetical protein
MALNLSTLTSPATSGDVLAEALTTADFLEPVPVLRNLSRGSNKGGDAKQDVALNQPKALPLIDGKGYLYLSGVSGNYVSVPSSTDLDVLGDIDIQATFPKIESNGATQTFMGRYASGSKVFLLQMTNSRTLYFYRFAQFTTSSAPLSEAAKGVRATHRVSDDRVQFFETLDGTVWTQVGTDKTLPANTPFAGTSNFEVGTWSNGVNSPLTGAIQRCIVKDGIDGTSVLDVDFTSPNVRHGDTKFTCATGQVVTINQDSSSSNDVATIIKKPVLRFDGVNDFMDGLFNQTITDGYLFAAFSVLGGGGESGARILGVNSTGLTDLDAGGYFLARTGTSPDLITRYSGNSLTIIHEDVFDDSLGNILVESRLQNGSQISKVNNANEDNGTTSFSGDLSAEEFKIVSYTDGNNNAALDLEYLALFPASLTDAQADAVRNYINKRNNVFDLKDGFGYYFYNPQDLTSGAVTSWSGRIVGSDNGDSASIEATQTDANDQPVGDGYVVTFADNSDHLDIPSTTQAGWQVVGASRGTFVYKVNANAVTELNLLGNAGTVRQAGYLYGIILLPESATGADIEQARKLLIDRGAADGTVSTNIYRHFDGRSDIVDFKYIATSSVTNNANFAWRNCSNMTSFAALDLSHCPSFTNTWQSCSSLTSFPADAKLGTEANNVNFESAWQDSGLTSFSTPLPTATRLFRTWQNTALTSFSSDISSATNAFAAWRICTSLTSFNAALPLVTDLRFGFDGCSSLPSFDVSIPVAITMDSTWLNCSSLTDFSADVFSNWNPSIISSGVFNNTWDGCPLTAQSVENILVSIDASGKYATSTGLSGGSALADAGIDIDYNVATGSLSVATTAAIDSLSGKGWQVYINGELVIPNILDLEPAAAYSLRSFDADLDPNVVNVRRSSDNATSDFTASEVSDGTLVAWVGAGNDGHVTTWYDQGGTNHATQTSTSAQPKIVDGGALVTEGGKAALDFDGVDDVFNMPAGMISSLSDIFVSAVFTGSDGSNDYGVVLGEPTERIYVPYVTSNILYIGYSDSAVKLSDGAYSDGLQLVTLSVDDTTASGFRNSSAFSIQPTASASSSPPVITTRGDRIGSFGSSVFTSMNFSEVIIFNTDQVANRTGIENNINDHFDIYS